MADRGDTHYHTPTLNRWFAFSSVFLLVITIWMVIDDWNAEWKGYQRNFRTLDLRKAEEARGQLEAEGILTKKAELEQRVTAARSEVQGRSSDLAALEKELFNTKEDRYNKEQALKSLKGQYAMARYRFDELIFNKAAADAIAGAEEALVEMDGEIAAREFAFAEATTAMDGTQRKIDELKAVVAEAERILTIETSELARVETRIEQLDPSQAAVKLANFVRDFPGLDFVGPNLKVQKYVLPNLTFELNFTKKPRIDMCTTCHMGMEREGFEEAAQPFATHPRLDLFLSSKSPHPAKDFGCTICHRGAGEGLSFQTADHRPTDAEQEHAWHEEHHWHKQHHWDYPMLKAQHVEASCVQCHKTSMELIAPEAPKVSEGYQLFERYGCYACHKVDWFPTKRRPGPSLTNVAAKLEPSFVDAWITAPRAFRPSTWMPQVFHLENYAADQVIVPNPNYGQDAEPILGQAWNNTAVAAVTAFIFANHPREELAAIPVEGDGERGRELYNLVGCTACHNTAGHAGEELAITNLSDEVGRYNDAGPNLRGVAAKISATWLYHWLKDPSKWWGETRMPNLRLSDQDAADITAYIMEDPDGTFKDVPDGWQSKSSPVDARTLQEQARWFFQKIGRTAVEQRLAGGDPEFPWNDQDSLLVAVGKEWVNQQGCFSCHEIRGMENGMPIGTELSNWGSKTVDKLDFGVSYRKELGGHRMLDHEYREEFLEQKLHRPRFFDLEKVKNPKEKLRMPWFDFSEDEVQSLTTFVLGLVDDEVQRAKMNPSPVKAAMDTGLRVLRQKNCVACHVVEPGQVTYEHENGQLITVGCELLPLPEEKLPPRMQDLASLEQELAAWSEYYEEDAPEEIGIRLLSAHGDAGVPGENLFLTKDKVRAIEPPLGGDFVRFVTSYYFNGVAVVNPDYDPSDEESYPDMPWTIEYDADNQRDLIEDVDGTRRAYAQEEYDKVRWTFAPPVLLNEGHKVQPEWFYAFLKDPVELRKQIRVRMPSFHYDEGEAEAVAQYFAGKARADWHVRYAHNLRLALGREKRPALSDLSTHKWTVEEAREWPLAALVTNAGPGLAQAVVSQGSGVSLANLAAIERGVELATTANFAKLQQWGEAQGFEMVGPPAAGFELIERRQASYVPEVALGHALAKQGVNCFQCHWFGATPPDQKDAPLAWAPDLQIARERLREDYVWEWLWSPKYIYPGTAMPDNFAADMPQYQNVAPESTNRGQIEAVLDWLFHSEKTPTTPN